MAEFPSRGNGRRVLDIGCGYGHIGIFLAQHDFDVTGVDFPDTAHSPEMKFVPADLDRGLLPALDGSFDYIICADVLEHLRDPFCMLVECRKVLAPGGVLIASLPNSGHAYFRYQILRGRFPQEDRGLFDRTHLRFYTWDGWVELLARAGFAIQTLRCSGTPFSEAYPHLPLVHVLEWLSFTSARIWKRLFAYQFVVRAVP